MPNNAVTVRAFTPETFIRMVCRGRPTTDDVIPEQVKYLARYLDRLGARTLVHEAHYMDRHYVDEYAAYYSRMLSPPSNAVERIHLFANRFSEGRFAALLARSLRSSADREVVEHELMRTPGGDRDGWGQSWIRLFA
jgi:hypothetical protein